MKQNQSVLERENQRLRERIADLEVRLRASAPPGARAEEWLRVTLTSIGDAVMATDSDARIIFLNPVASSLTGWGPEEALGRPVQDVFRIIKEDTREEAEDIAARVLREGWIVTLANHTALVTRDGREIPIEDSAAPIRDDAGNVTGVVIVFHDVTEKRRAQEALEASERSVRLKLDSILSPDGDIGNLELGDIIDVPAIQSLIDDFYKLTSLPMSILDLKGEVLVGAGWQEICTKFHRVHRDTERNCRESDTQLSAGVAPGECRLYRCKNNMWDIATPITVGGRHVGYIFSGQFFFEDEPLDCSVFQTQARLYGFDEGEYLGALDRVPRLSRATVETGMAFLMKLGHMLSQLSYGNIKLARLLAERDALTESLKRSGEMLNRAQEISHVGSWELDLLNNTLFWSDEVYRIFGLQPQEFGATYEAFLEAVHPDDRSAVDDAYSGSVREGRDTYEIAHRVVRRGTGEIRWVHEKCAHVRDDAGRIIRSHGMVQDITARRRAEEALRESEQRYRQLFEANPLGVISVDVRSENYGLIQSSNEAFLRMTGYSREELESGRLRWTDLTPPEHRPADERSIAEAREHGQSKPYEKEYIRKDGARLPVMVARAIVGDRRDRTIAFIADLTERRQAEQALREAQKLESIGVLAGGIAHDFNNLLTSILGNASLLEEDAPNGTRAQLRAIIESSEKAASLTRQLLAYAGKGLFVIADFDVARLVRSSADLIRVSIPKNVEVQTDVPHNLPAVRGDSSQIHQVVMNLVINAAESIGDGSGGTVYIGAGVQYLDPAFARHLRSGLDPGSYIWIRVRDNGCGMDQPTIEKIFDPFFTTKFTGRGLGLAAVQGILRSHKGAIKVESAVGEGSTFTVYLPCCGSEAPASGRASAESRAERVATVLVVDDEEPVRAFTKNALERLGHSVLLAENGQQALDLLSSSDGVDLVLLDLVMPVAGGAQALSVLREKWPDMQVLVSSGYSREEALRMGIPEDLPFIGKPYTVKKLAAAVAEVLKAIAR